MLPGILNHLGPEGVNHLKKIVMANTMAANRAGEDDIPDLVQNFESQLSAGTSRDDEVDIDEAVKKGPVEVVD